MLAQVRQKVGVLDTDRTFKTTANGRNEAMFREATDFAQHLRSMERDLRGISKQVDCEYDKLQIRTHHRLIKAQASVFVL